MPIKYGSVCSGVEAFSLAVKNLNYAPAFFSEIEPFPSTVLEYRWPGVYNLGDFTKIKGDEYDGSINLLVGGTPCQDYSIAGKRKGMAGSRGGLSGEYFRLAARLRPRWLLWENVPGVLSSNKGRDFGSILRDLEEGGYGFANRILDAQYVRVPGTYEYAVPQRRRRLFLVGYLGDWRPAAAVLFEQESLSRHSPPNRTTGKGITRAFEVGASGGREVNISATLDSGCKDGAIRNQTGMLCMAHGQGNAEICQEHAPTLNCNHEAPFIFRKFRESGRGFWQEDEVSGLLKTNGSEPTNVVCLMDQGGAFMEVKNGITGTLRHSCHGNEPIVCYENHGQDGRIKKCDNVSPQINAKAGTGGGNLPLIQTFGIAENIIGRKDDTGGNGVGAQSDIQYPLTSTGVHGVCYSSTVRRLIPLECERLMGFPDNHTRIPWKNKPAEQCPDGPRYKACGNSMAVNVMRWLAIRIQMVDQIKQGV